jgi:hypothetical protein
MRLCLAAAVAALAVAPAATAAQRNRVHEPDVAARVEAPLVREASGYALYQEDVSDLEAAPFGSLEDIDGALEMIATHNPDALARAWIAYAALVAAQSPEFVDGVRQAADYYGRDAVVAGLRNDPSYAGQVNGAETARQSVLSTVSSDASRLRDISATVKQQAYSLQSATWAGARSGDNDERIAWLDAVSLQPRGASDAVLASLAAPGAVGSDRMGAASAEVRANFWRAFRLGPGTAHASGPSSPSLVSLQANPRYQSVIDQVVTLAAFEALDAANAGDAASVAPLLDEPSTRTCMTMARLHFQQCVAASHFRYEDPFCIAEHGVKDVGDCFSKVVGH